jgi:hypothetical protein
MSFVGTIRSSVKKTIVEGSKEYPEGMSRQEYYQLKEQLEKELEMVDEVKEGWVMLGPVGGKGTHDFAGDKRSGTRTFTTDKSKFFKKKTNKLGLSQSSSSSPADKKSRFEEEAQIDEVSTKTKLDYIRSASSAVATHAMHKGMDIAHRVSKGEAEQSKSEKETSRKLMNRQSGIQRAARMLSKEEVEALDETSPSNKIKKNIAAKKMGVTAARSGDERFNTKMNPHVSSKILGRQIQKEESDEVSEGKYNWDKEHKRGLTDTMGNRMLNKKSLPKPGMSKNALAVLAAKANAVGKGGKIAEENMLDEGRGRPPKEGSAAWHRQQAAQKGEEGETQEADKNIHTQLHKVISAKKPVTFNNGKTHEISPAHAHKALALLQNSKSSERLALQHSLAHSHDRFHETIKTGKAVSEPAKPKISLAKRVSEAVDPSTTAADKKAMRVFKKRDKDGVLRLYKRSGGPSGKDIIDAMESLGTKTSDVEMVVRTKPNETSMADDSIKKMEKDPLASKMKFKLPPTQGNKPIGGEDQVHVGKFSMEESRLLNNLYEDLSEENKKIYEQILSTENGKEQLVAFAIEQGY